MVSQTEERRQGRAQLIGLHEDDGAFDREFWRAIAPSKRLEQVWEIVEEYQAWRRDARQSRLQRFVLRLERRGR